MATYLSGEDARIKSLTLGSGSGTPVIADATDWVIQFTGEPRNVTTFTDTYQQFIVVKQSGRVSFTVQIDSASGDSPPIAVGNRYLGEFQNEGTDSNNVYTVTFHVISSTVLGADQQQAPVQRVRYEGILGNTAPSVA